MGKLLKIKNILLSCLIFFIANSGNAYTADRVWWKKQTHSIRITISYTVPELKEKRQAYIDFQNFKQALKFYKAVVSGADFYILSGDKVVLTKPKRKPVPW